MAVLVDVPGYMEKIIQQPEVVFDDIFFPYIVLELEVLFLDDFKTAASGTDADVGEEEQLASGIKRCKVKRNLVDALQHSSRQLWRIQYQVKYGQIAYFIDDPLAHEFTDVFRHH